MALALAFAPHGVAAAAPNALLVVDQNHQRVLRAELASGVVSQFSPPAGAQTNLLTSARGIGVGRDGTIVVTNYVENTVVEIDPATGAQFPVADFFSGDPPGIGVGPLDVAVSPRDPAPGFLPTLGVASQGGLHQVVRSALDTTGSLLAPYPSPYGTSLGRFLVARDPGTTHPIDYYLATGGTPAILRYDGASDTLALHLDSSAADAIQGLAAPESGPYELVVSYLFEPCPASENGVRLIGSSRSDSLLGGAFECPGPVAFDSATGMLYTADVRESPQRVIGYDTDLFPTAPTISFATLPSGTIASDMAVASVPEPSAAALSALVVFTLFALGTAPGRRALSGIAACTALAASTPASAVQLSAGDLLVTDALGARVLHVAPDTGAVTPFSPRASSGPNLLFAPAGIAIDPDGAVFVADSFADRIVRIDPVTGAQSVVHDFSAQLGDFGPSDVGTAPQGLDLEDGVTGLDRRDLFVASADGLHRVSRSSDATFTAPLSSAPDVLLGADVSVQETYLGEPYSLWVVANGVLVRWYFENGATQALTESNARNVSGVEYALDTPFFTRSMCFGNNSLNGLFVYAGSFGGTQLEGGGYATCLGRPLAVASPTLVYGTYGDDQIVSLVPTIDGYASAIVATLPEGDVPAVAADLAVSPVTFPVPEPSSAAAGAIAAFALWVRSPRALGGAASDPVPRGA